MPTTLVISDLHAPYHHESALDFLRTLAREYKPDRVVCIGDEIDAHGWGRWERHPDALGQADELRAAVKFLKRLYKVFPTVKVCESNHTMRAVKTAMRAGLPSAWLRCTREVLEAPRTWRWAADWIVDGVLYHHGEGYGGKTPNLDAAIVARRNVVIGHVHSAGGVLYHNNGRNTIWGLSVGCLIDLESYAMQYAKTGKNKSVLGAGVVVDGIPHFIPLSA